MRPKKNIIRKEAMEELRLRRSNPITESEILSFGVKLANYLAGNTNNTSGINPKFIEIAEDFGRNLICLDPPHEEGLSPEGQAVLSQMKGILPERQIRKPRLMTFHETDPEEEKKLVRGVKEKLRKVLRTPYGVK